MCDDACPAGARTRQFVVNGTQVGENGINYGKWMRIVEAENEDAARAEAVRIVKAQGGATAHECTVMTCSLV